MSFLSILLNDIEVRFLKNILKGSIPLSERIKNSIKPSFVIVRLAGFS